MKDAAVITSTNLSNPPGSRKLSAQKVYFSVQTSSYLKYLLAEVSSQDPSWEDMLIAHSTLPGYVSYRCPVTASQLSSISNLCYILEISSEELGLLRVSARCLWSTPPTWTSGTCLTRPPGCSASTRQRPGQSRVLAMRYF